MFCAVSRFDRSEGISAIGKCRGINGVVHLKENFVLCRHVINQIVGQKSESFCF